MTRSQGRRHPGKDLNSRLRALLLNCRQKNGYLFERVDETKSVPYAIGDGFSLIDNHSVFRVLTM